VTGVQDLRTPGDEDRPRVGAKAANLGRMLRAGLPVPPGFCVDAAVPADDPAIQAAYRTLGAGPVAVRSSAVGEDETGAAFAGVFQSRLGVCGDENLAEAIEHVRQSAQFGHVRTYQPGREPPRMAVIVQQMVDAEAAGVVFTRDPLDPAGERLAVTAT
jgi:pyruvate,water dikinase